MHRFSDEKLPSGKIALIVEYNGQAYHGWQSQKDPVVPTVQLYLEQAISKVANHEVQVLCAGRTDARVHGTAQVVHFETMSSRSEKAWVFGINTYLPSDIAVRWAGSVDDQFHARFSAVARTYRYIISNAPIRPANFDGQVTYHDYPLDHQKMNEAAQALVGEHDISAFQAAACQSNTPFRFVEYVSVSRFGDLLVMEIKANAFLLHMVRNIVGSLLEVGEGRKPVTWLGELLSLKDRSQAGMTAKPDGLYFVRAHYPDDCAIEQLPMGPLFLSPWLDTMPS